MWRSVRNEAECGGVRRTVVSVAECGGVRRSVAVCG